jgi:hypothetical protein
MSLSNAGTNTAELLGAGLIKVLGVTTTNFANLWLALTIRSLMKLLPILFLFLVPEGTPTSDFGTIIVEKGIVENDSGTDLTVMGPEPGELVTLTQRHHDGL